MRTAARVHLVGGVALMLTIAGVASAAVPTPTTIATTHAAAAPRVFVDSRGTVNIAWEAAPDGGQTRLGYARRPAGAAHFTNVDLPNVPGGVEEPFIYEPAPGVLRVIADVTLKPYAWQSTDDGATWKGMDTSKLAAQYSDGIYIPAVRLVIAPGGPILYAGSDGYTGPVAQLNADLTQATTLESLAQGLTAPDVASTAAGTIFALGAGETAELPFQVGPSKTGSISFPACASPGGNAQIVAGKTVAVVAKAACGHAWTRTIAADGTLGPVVTVGSTAINGNQVSFSGMLPFGEQELSVDPGGAFTLAFVAPGGDVRVARSSDGSHWTTAPGSVPTAIAGATASSATVSTGAATWVAETSQSGTAGAYAVRAIALSDTYRTPKASSKGIRSAHHASLGSLAAAVPGKVALKPFRKNGKIKVRLVDALPNKVAASVTVTRKAGSTVSYDCQGATNTRLAARHVKTLTLSCGNGAVVIGGPAASGVAAKKGDVVTFTFTGRNGPLTVTSHVG